MWCKKCFILNEDSQRVFHCGGGEINGIYVDADCEPPLRYNSDEELSWRAEKGIVEGSRIL
jgi:hypothetical protein